MVGEEDWVEAETGPTNGESYQAPPNPMGRRLRHGVALKGWSVDYAMCCKMVPTNLVVQPYGTNQSKGKLWNGIQMEEKASIGKEKLALLFPVKCLPPLYGAQDVGIKVLEKCNLGSMFWKVEMSDNVDYER
ncbi:hypothetical protein Gotur_017172 [Gossypium turneri]